MRMMKSLIFAAAALAAPSIAASAVDPNMLGSIRPNRRAWLGGNEPVHSKSKNPPTKRKLKANRLHISRRVKRKHRRA